MPAPRPLSIGRLCDSVVEALDKFHGEALESNDSFQHEVRTLHKFCELIDRVRRARTAPVPKEEEHWKALNVLMRRCGRTLQGLQERLARTENEEFELHYNEPWKICHEDRNPVAISTLRAHVNLFTQTIQMSLQAFNLIHQKRSNPAIENIQNHVHALSTAFVDLRNVLSHRNSLIDRDSAHSIDMDDEFCADVARCIKTAEAIADLDPETVHEIGHPVAAEKILANGHGHEEKHLVSRKRSIDGKLAVRTSTSSPEESHARNGFTDAILKLDESAYDEHSDPEPHFKEGFSPDVYGELISTLQRETTREIKVGNFGKAEKSHLKAMHYFEEREKHCDIIFDNEGQMNETLADIYVKCKKFDQAKVILNNLLKLENQDSDRKWRYYHALAVVYLEQKRLPEAEKFARRAFGGREKMYGKGHGLILQSASLLAQIYEQQGEEQQAQVFRNLYESAVYSQQQPQISKHVGTRRVKWNPDLSVNINQVYKSGKTPLVTAITCDDEESLQQVLHSGADLEYRGPDGISPLMHAVSRGHEKIAGVLLSRGAQVDSTTAEWTPLHKAVELGDVNMMRLLINSHADVEAKAPKKYIIRKDPKARRKSTDLDSSEDDHSEDSGAGHGWTPLLRACLGGKETVIRLLLDSGADIEARTPNKATPLICAAEGRDEAIIDLLLMRGAEVEAEDEFGWKPLHRATTSKGGIRVAQLLLDHDADINSVDTYKKTPLHHAIEKDDEAMVAFLLRAQADIGARDIAKRTPLHTAIECRLENMVYILLEFGADAKAKDKAGRDALSLATHTARRSPEIVKLLTKHKRSNSNSNGNSNGSGSGSGRSGSGSASRMASTVETPDMSLSSAFSSASTNLSGSTLGNPMNGSGSNSWWKRGKKKKDR